MNKIIKIISEHKKVKKGTLKPGFKRVEAIVQNENGLMFTQHLDIPKS